MTVETFKEIATRHGGLDSVIQVSFDDNVLFMIDTDAILKEECFVTIDDEPLLAVKGKFHNKETGMIDIPATVYRTLADIRTITVLDKVEDRKKIDSSNQYSI